MDEQQMANAVAEQSTSLTLRYTTQEAPDTWVKVRVGLIEFGLVKRLHGIDMMQMAQSDEHAAEGDEGTIDLSKVDPETFSILLFEALRRRHRLDALKEADGSGPTLDAFYGWVEEMELDDSPEA